MLLDSEYIPKKKTTFMQKRLRDTFTKYIFKYQKIIYKEIKSFFY